MPFIGRKNGTLTARQQSYDDAHGLYEHLFGQLWHWGLFGTSGVAARTSCTSPCVFCCISRIFAFGGRSVTLFVDHGTMPQVLTDKSNPAAMQDEGEDEADVCALS